MRYSLGQDMILVILTLISTLALLSEHGIVSFVFFVLAILFVIFERKIHDYVKSA